jgi:hypothetical protein
VPINNNWALIGAALATIAVFVLNALINFFGSGMPWPDTTTGWLHLILPALCAGILAAITPHYSISEARTGRRMINAPARDAPVLDIGAPDRIIDSTPTPPLSSPPAGPPNFPPGASAH